MVKKFCDSPEKAFRKERNKQLRKEEDRVLKELEIVGNHKEQTKLGEYNEQQG